MMHKYFDKYFYFSCWLPYKFAWTEIHKKCFWLCHFTWMEILKKRILIFSSGSSRYWAQQSGEHMQAGGERITGAIVAFRSNARFGSRSATAFLHCVGTCAAPWSEAQEGFAWTEKGALGYFAKCWKVLLRGSRHHNQCAGLANGTNAYGAS